MASIYVSFISILAFLGLLNKKKWGGFMIVMMPLIYTFILYVDSGKAVYGIVSVFFTNSIWIIFWCVHFFLFKKWSYFHTN